MSVERPMEAADVVVIGGGAIGLAVAYELLRGDDGRFGRTVVIERGVVGCGATHASGGMIAPISEAEVQSSGVVELGLDSLRRYGDFVGGVEKVGGVGCGYRRDGTLWAAADGDELRELEHLQALQRDKGVSSQMLTAAELLERESHLASRVAGGLQIELDHNIDQRKMTRALVAAIGTLGGRVCEGQNVAKLGRDERGWRVEGSDATGQPWAVQCRAVVMAAGAWSDQLQTPLPSLGMRPVKGQAIRLEQGKAPLLRHVIRSPRVYLVPAGDGALFVGATSEEQGFDASPTAGAVMDLLRYGWRLLPGIYDLPLTEIVVGFRPALRDNQPAIGAFSAPELGELYLAVGHYRDGILLTPATAHYLARAMREGAVPAEIAAFTPDRLLPRAKAEGS